MQKRLEIEMESGVLHCCAGRVTYYHSRLLVQLWNRALTRRWQDDVGIYLGAYSTCRLLAGSTVTLATIRAAVGMHSFIPHERLVNSVSLIFYLKNQSRKSYGS